MKKVVNPYDKGGFDTYLLMYEYLLSLQCTFVTLMKIHFPMSY